MIPTATVGKLISRLAVPAGTHSTLQDVAGATADATTGNVCLTFSLAAGETRAFTIDNSYPLGDQRTIGSWKRWNSYTMGSGAAAKAAQTGNHLMDEFLPQTLGGYTVDTCAKGLAVLQAASGKYAENHQSHRDEKYDDAIALKPSQRRFCDNPQIHGADGCRLRRLRGIWRKRRWWRYRWCRRKRRAYWRTGLQ